MSTLLKFIIIPTKDVCDEEKVVDILVRNIERALSRSGFYFEINRSVNALQLKAPPEALNILRNMFGISHVIYEKNSHPEKVEGPGGLPIGSMGRALSLFSGGFDSPVASWMMLRSGVQLDFIHFNLVGGGQVYWASRVLKFLVETWCHGYEPKLHLVDLRPIVAKLVLHVKESLRQVVLRRVMYKVAEKIALKEGVKALVTGESLGQVSSQTLVNIGVAEKGVDVVIMRPLLGLDKVEIMEKARIIGTYKLSEQVKECCILARGPVATRASMEKVIAEERKIPEELLDEAVEKHGVYRIHEIEPHEFLPKDTMTLDFIPEGALVVDTRPLEDYKAWHFPGAIHISELDVDDLEEGTVVVFYCESGEVSRVLAEELRRAGVRAYSFRGGVEQLRRYATRVLRMSS
ncbi:MAG: hypothetical protein DRN15_08875 [Thermoprotei archaeon]|nr:MAG: hypothetical protein DRN15_08875 [Thermoprotei archaeon]